MAGTKPLPGRMLTKISDTIWHNQTMTQFEGILPKGPYLPCVSMAGRALLAGYPGIIKNILV